MKKILAALFVTLFLCATANAYTVSFDYDGTGGGGTLTDFDEFDFVEVGEWNADASEFGDVFTYQTDGGVFKESFTIKVTEGSNSILGAAGDVDFSPDLFIDVNLTGQYVNDGAIYFTGGSGTFYNDIGGDFKYTGVAGENQIATFSFADALVSELSGTLLGGNTLGMKLDFVFLFDTVDANYWGPLEQELVGKNWLLSFVGTRIELANDEGAADPAVKFGDYGDGYTTLIEWDLANGQIEFDAVPEPATMFLFGLGLIGLAGASRRKLS